MVISKITWIFNICFIPMKQNWEPRNKPTCIWAKKNFNNEAKNIQWGKESFLNKWFWENQKATCKGIKPECYLSPQTKNNSKQIKDPNIRPKTINYIDKNVSAKLMKFGLNNEFKNIPIFFYSYLQ